MKSFLKKRGFANAYSLSGFISGLAVLLIFTAKPVKKMSSHTLLCLGDSYTIGEGVLPAETFPVQTIHFLRNANIEFGDPEIVARTGWTTDELQDAMGRYKFKDSYDFVTLLIGVNNQYRGGSVNDYTPQFELLLKQAIRLANEKRDHVIVLSIPDWGATPFAKSMGRDQFQISREIDAYNEANKKLAEEYQVNYIDITAGSRDAVNDLNLVARDGLHPSAKEYTKWAEKLSQMIKLRLN